MEHEWPMRRQSQPLRSTNGRKREPDGRLIFGSLRDAWKGEAADFTPLLAQQFDDIGNAIEVELASIGRIEVSAAGGRRIDILAAGANGANFVIENQDGVLNHDQLMRGLAYAVASHSRGLIVIAEEHYFGSGIKRSLNERPHKTLRLLPVA